MVMEVRPLQPRKAYPPMDLTEFGILIEIKLCVSQNTSEPIDVTEVGIIVFLHPAISSFDNVFIIPLQLLRES